MRRIEYTYNAPAHEAFIVNGAIGGIASAVQGGEFGNGFIAAGFSSLAGGVIGQIDNPVGKVVARGIIGGTISEVTGGKFANGASSAAFAQIIGDLSNYARSDDRKNQDSDWSQADEDWLQETMVQTAIDLENGDVYALGGQMLQERDMLDSEFGPGTYMGVMEDAGGFALEGASYLLPIPAYRVGKWAVGPAKQWIRFGPSFSKSMDQSVSYSIRWGASPAKNGKYIKQIPSTFMQKVNQGLRNRKFPGSHWRLNDTGHLHIKR